MYQYYAPEDVSGAVLNTELTAGLANRGHKVTVLTGVPNYPLGTVYPGYRNKIYQYECIDKVKVARTWSYIAPKKQLLSRILNLITYTTTSIYGGILNDRPDILVSVSPILPLGISAFLLRCLWRIPWVIQLADIYPEAAINAGILKNRSLISFFSASERFLYRIATHISVIAETFRKNLVKKGVPLEKISFCCMVILS